MKTITSFIVALTLLTISAQAQLIGYEPFDYTNSIVDADEGVFWDFKNQLSNRHTGQSSDWDLAPGFSGVAVCSGGQLFTSDAGIIREYGGTNEGEGAINDSSIAKKVYYRINMTRGTGVSWCGLSSFDFANERLFFGLYPGGGNFGIYNQNTFTPIAVSTVPVSVGQSYTIVARLDYATDTISLYVNPNLDATEAANTPVATAAYSGGLWSTAIRVASGGNGIALWDDLTCATTWESLRTYAVTNSATSGIGSLQNATILAGTSGGRVTFPHAGAIYAVKEGVSGGRQRLIRFNRNQPSNLTLEIPIFGLPETYRITGIDFQNEGNGKLYAMSVDLLAPNIGKLYTINTSTGEATAVGGVPFSTTLPSPIYINGFEFEYRNIPPAGMVATIRVTANNGLNLRLDPTTGLIAANDTTLTNPSISGIASDVWRGGPAPATLYGIDLNTANPSLWRVGGPDGIPGAENGIVTRIGPLNLPTTGSTINGFDISENGKAYLNETRIVTPGNWQNILHSVDLKTGATTQIGQIGNEIFSIYGMSVASSKILAFNLADGPNDTIIDGGSHGGQVRIGFNTTMNLDPTFGEALALRKLQIESADEIVQSGGLLVADGCTFYRCLAGAINTGDGAIKLNRCTFVENTNFSGGALRINSITADINHCTFVGNHSFSTSDPSRGGGAIKHTFGILKLTGCVVAGNTSASGNGPDIMTGSATINTNVTATACVIGDGKDSTISVTVANRNIMGTTSNPVAHKLAPLADYGGCTWTMPPLMESVAINRARTTNFTGDQRGFSINGFPDSGAAEFRGNSDLALYWNTDWDSDGNTFGIETAVGTAPEVSDPADLKNLRIRYDSGSPVLTFAVDPGARPFTRWVVKRSTDLVNFSDVIYSFDGPTLGTVVAPGIFLGSEGGLILLRDNPPNPAKAFYRLEAVLTP